MRSMICSTFRKIFKSCVYASFQPFKVSNIGTHSPIIYWMKYICHQSLLSEIVYTSRFLECLTKHNSAHLNVSLLNLLAFCKSTFAEILLWKYFKHLKSNREKEKYACLDVYTCVREWVIKERFSCKQSHMNLKHTHTKSTCDVCRRLLTNKLTI